MIWNLGITARAPRLVSSLCLSLPPQHRHGQSFGEFSAFHPKNELVLTPSSQANIFGTGKCYRLRGALVLIRFFRAGPCKLFVLLQGPLFFSTISCLVLYTDALQIGACRHGDRCSRKHIKPPFSQTILLPNVYHNPANDPNCKLSEKELQEGFDAVFEDLYW